MKKNILVCMKVAVLSMLSSNAIGQATFNPETGDLFIPAVELLNSSPVETYEVTLTAVSGNDFRLTNGKAVSSSESLKISVEACANTSMAVERLDCFDAIAERFQYVEITGGQIDSSSGEWVIVDANGEVIAYVDKGDFSGPDYYVIVSGVKAFIVNDAASNTVRLYPWKHTGGQVYYTSDDCSGTPFVRQQDYLHYLEGFGFGVGEGDLSSQTINSTISLGGWSASAGEYREESECEPLAQVVDRLQVLTSYDAAALIEGASYPVSAEEQ